MKPVKPEVQAKTPVLKTDEKSKKKLASKKKTKKRSYKSKRVFLTPLSKPLKKKTIVEAPLPIETTPKKVETDLTFQDS